MNRARGATSHHSGRSAEDRVRAHYESDGCELLHSRWRGRGGEIDLILRAGAVIVFVEVKASRDFASAAAQLSPRQARRILDAAAEFLAGQPGGALTEARIDVALVDGTGRVEILKNAVEE